jgi:hypothetical protein
MRHLKIRNVERRQIRIREWGLSPLTCSVFVGGDRVRGESPRFFQRSASNKAANSTILEIVPVSKLHQQTTLKPTANKGLQPEGWCPCRGIPEKTHCAKRAAILQTSFSKRSARSCGWLCYIQLRKIPRNWTVAGGYRMLEGGADVDKVRFSGQSSHSLCRLMIRAAGLSSPGLLNAYRPEDE